MQLHEMRITAGQRNASTTPLGLSAGQALVPVLQGFGLALSVAATSTVMCVAGESGPAREVPAMAWSIAEVARMSKVTSRTLRHYDEIGLLPPAWIGSNRHRYYEEGRSAAAAADPADAGPGPGAA